MPVKPKPKAKRTKQPAQESSNKWRPLLIWGGLIVGVLLLAYLLFLNLRGPEAIRDLVTFSRQSRQHVAGEIPVADLPPAGGEHANIWQNCGIYDEPIKAENAMHSLEHGAVWITYQPDLPDEDVASLRDMVRGESHLLLSPYPGLKSPIVLTAWQVQLELSSVDDDRIPEFIDRYQQGSTTPERGATCSNGIGTPLP